MTYCKTILCGMELPFNSSLENYENFVTIGPHAELLFGTKYL